MAITERQGPYIEDRPLQSLPSVGVCGDRGLLEPVSSVHVNLLGIHLSTRSTKLTRDFGWYSLPGHGDRAEKVVRDIRGENGLAVVYDGRRGLEPQFAIFVHVD